MEIPDDRNSNDCYRCCLAVTPAERILYNRLSKMQGTLFKVIGDIESIKLIIASDRYKMTRKNHEIKCEGNAVCYDCGEDLIAPADGQPYWCISCSMKQDEIKRGR